MTLQVLESSGLTRSVRDEICGFLDSQKTSHPFQFPQWSAFGARFALVRQAGEPCWFASCGLQYPLGARIPWFRSFIVNRGPVCDNADLWRTALLELIRYMKKHRYIYLDTGPDWVSSNTLDMANLFQNRDWKRVSQARYSLRVPGTTGTAASFGTGRIAFLSPQRKSRWPLRSSNC